MSASEKNSDTATATQTNSGLANGGRLAYFSGLGAAAAAKELEPEAALIPFERAAEPADTVVLLNVIQAFSYREALAILTKAVNTLKPGGRIVVSAPSMDWVAAQWGKHKPSPAAEFVVYGVGEVAHKSGYTMHKLRQFLSMAGAVVTEATVSQSPLELSGPNGAVIEEYEVNAVLGEKHARA